MSGDDWRVGDLALCVCDDPCPIYPGSEGGIVSGGVYTVAAVMALKDVYGRENIGLQLDRHNVTHPKTGAVGYHNSYRFRKIRPHTTDEEDRETIRLLNEKKEPVA